MTESKDPYTLEWFQSWNHRCQTPEITYNPPPIRFVNHADQKWTDSKSQETIPSQKKTLFPSQNRKSPPLHSDWLVSVSVFNGTYLACLQTRPICPQYILILEHTGGHCMFRRDEGANIIVCICNCPWTITRTMFTQQNKIDPQITDQSKTRNRHIVHLTEEGEAKDTDEMNILETENYKKQLEVVIIN